MNKYELAVVVSAKVEDDVRAGVIEKVKELIARFGGNVTDVDEWGKKRLAYESDSTVPAELESRMRIMENVIRFLCVKQEAQRKEDKSYE